MMFGRIMERQQHRGATVKPNRFLVHHRSAAEVSAA